MTDQQPARGRKVLTQENIDKWLQSPSSPKTRQLYRMAMTLWQDWMSEHSIKWSDAEPHDAAEWRNDLQADGYAPGTITVYMSAVHSFYTWWKYRSPFTGVSRPRRELNAPLRWLTHAELQAFLTSTKASSRHRRQMIGLLLLHGLRTREVVNATFRDMHYVGDEPMMMLRGKGGVTRDIRLQPELALIISNYKAQTKSRWIVNVSEEQVHENTIAPNCIAIARHAELSDPSQVKPHVIRRSVASAAARAGVPLTDVQSLLGHQSLRTTAMYLRGADPADNRALDTVFDPQPPQNQPVKRGVDDVQWLEWIHTDEYR